MNERYLFKAKTTKKEKGEFDNVWVKGEFDCIRQQILHTPKSKCCKC